MNSEVNWTSGSSRWVPRIAEGGGELRLSGRGREDCPNSHQHVRQILSTKHSYAELILVKLEEELRGSVGVYTCTCKIVLHLSLFLFLWQGATTVAACGTFYEVWPCGHCREQRRNPPWRVLQTHVGEGPWECRVFCSRTFETAWKVLYRLCKSIDPHSQWRDVLARTYECYNSHMKDTVFFVYILNILIQCSIATGPGGLGNGVPGRWSKSRMPGQFP